MNQFNDILNSASTTTKFVFKDKSPILYVYHYEDGMWQFSGDEEIFEDEDYLVEGSGAVFEVDLKSEKRTKSPTRIRIVANDGEKSDMGFKFKLFMLPPTSKDNNMKIQSQEPKPQ